MELILLIIVSGSLAGSFTCSLCEAALYGVTPTRVEVLRRGRIPGSARLAKLRERIDEPVAGIAVFNSLSQPVGAAWTGALGHGKGSGTVPLAQHGKGSKHGKGSRNSPDPVLTRFDSQQYAV